MVKYLCNRCGHQSKHKGNFKNHLNRKNICEPLLEDISIDEVKFLYGLIQILVPYHLVVLFLKI